MESNRRLWVALITLVVVSAASFFIRLDAEGISRSQEGRVLETAREMRERGDYLVPHLLGQTRFEKPPLLYWITAAGYALSGRVNELGGRVPVALFAIGCVLVLYMIGARHMNPRAGFFAALALATGPLWVQHARLAETDVPQAFFVTLALLAFLEEKPLLAWITMGIGFLNKGPATLVVPVVTLAAWRIWSGHPRALLCDCRWWFVLVCLAIGLSWYLAVLALRHESVSVFFTELSYLVFKPEERHTESFFYYLKEIWNFAPWTAAAIAALVWGFRELRRRTEAPSPSFVAALSDRRNDSSQTTGGQRPPLRPQTALKFALTWFLVMFLILMLTQNKQRHYLVLLLPPCALLAGWMIDRLTAWRAWVAPATLALGVLMAAGNIYKEAIHDPARSENVVLRDFVRTVTAQLRLQDEFVFLQSPAYDRNLIALSYYSERPFRIHDASALGPLLSENRPLGIVTTAGPLPPPMREVLRAKVGRLNWTFWTNR